MGTGVCVIKFCKQKDIGVISYNETPLKALLGITVISTDFEGMGKAAAKLVLSNKKRNLKKSIPLYRT